MKKIAVIGVGGVGGYFGGKLTKLISDEIAVYFVARGEHLSRIKTNGLVLKTAKKGTQICNPTVATDCIEDLPLLDLCFICVKSFSLSEILLQLKSKITESTVIIPLLNGVDIAQRIRMVISTGIVFPACVYVGTHIESPGIVSQNGGACTIHLGYEPLLSGKSTIEIDELYRESGALWIVDLFKKAEILHVWHHDIYPEIWEKFAFICSYGTVTACFNKSVGEVMHNVELSQKVQSMINEIVKLAEKQKVQLDSDIKEVVYEKGSSFPFETKTSFQRDFERKKSSDERDIFAGTVVRMSRNLGFTCPISEELLNKLNTIKPMEDQ